MPLKRDTYRSFFSDKRNSTGKQWGSLLRGASRTVQERSSQMVFIFFIRGVQRENNASFFLSVDQDLLRKMFKNVFFL